MDETPEPDLELTSEAASRIRLASLHFSAPTRRPAFGGDDFTIAATEIRAANTPIIHCGDISPLRIEQAHGTDGFDESLLRYHCKATRRPQRPVWIPDS